MCSSIKIIINRIIPNEIIRQYDFFVLSSILDWVFNSTNPSQQKIQKRLFVFFYETISVKNIISQSLSNDLWVFFIVVQHEARNFLRFFKIFCAKWIKFNSICTHPLENFTILDFQHSQLKHHVLLGHQCFWSCFHRWLDVLDHLDGITDHEVNHRCQLLSINPDIR